MADKKKTIAADSDEANALFLHMQELMDLLPKMEEKGACLSRARAAREAMRLERYRKGQENELRHIQEDFDTQIDAARAAKGIGDEDAERAARLNALSLGNAKGIRYGAEQNAAYKVKKALEAGGFADLDAARAASMEEEDFAALEDEVESFKADYAETLAACQSVLDEEGDE